MSSLRFEAPQAPRPLSFVKLVFDDKAPIPLARQRPGGTGTQAQVRLSRIEETVEDFRHAYLTFDADSIDVGGELSGVQYVALTAVLRTPDGEEVGRHEQCYAVRPSSHMLPFEYTIGEGCVLASEPRYMLRDLLNTDAIDYAAKRSVLELDVRHVGDRYKRGVPDRRIAAFTRQGNWTFRLKTELPTAVWALFGKRDKVEIETQVTTMVDAVGNETTVTDSIVKRTEANPAAPSFQPAGLIVEWSRFRGRDALPIRIQTGLIVTELFEENGKEFSRLALPLLLSANLRDMTGDIQFKVSAGLMFPLASGHFFKDVAGVVAPGFSLTFR